MSLLGFTVKDVKENMSRREVRSVCCFSISQGDPEASNKFKKVFQFSPTGYSLIIKTCIVEDFSIVKDKCNSIQSYSITKGIKILLLFRIRKSVFLNPIKLTGVDH